MENKSDTDTSKYPAVELAYEFVKPSYDVMVSRFEAANFRIQNLLTWAITPLFLWLGRPLEVVAAEGVVV
ncbi:MAG: hypothetical protein Q7R57_03135 [Dehalococcoidales bacterium]|nr:hypothetical protein [Dehalococcoidales bacterium]